MIINNKLKTSDGMAHRNRGNYASLHRAKFESNSYKIL